MEILKAGVPKKPKKLRRFFSAIVGDRIFESCASLSYYFLFSIFPLLIIISLAIATLQINQDSITSVLQNVLPDQLVGLINTYISEVSRGNSISLFLLSIVLTVYSMGKVIQMLKHKIRIAYRTYPKNSAIREWIISFVFVILLIVSFYATLILLVAGNHIMQWIGNFIEVSEEIFSLFSYLRILFIAAFMFFVLYGVYYLLPGIRLRGADVMPGTIFSMAGRVVMSWLFSYYADNMNDYSSVYGSLGAVIILMTWLYIINFVILSGAYINAQAYQNKYGKINV